MNKIAFYVALAVLIGTTVGAEVRYGRSLNSAAQKQLRSAAADALSLVPKHFGLWHLQKDLPLDAKSVKLLQCDGYVNRTYVHSESGDSVTMTLLVGPAGPLVAHTPEICFTSREFELLEPAIRCEVADASGASDSSIGMLRTTFRVESAAAQSLRVYYAWRGLEGGWQVPATPRLSLGAEPLLYKLQVAAFVSSSKLDDDDAARQFLGDLLPLLDQELFGT